MDENDTKNQVEDAAGNRKSGGTHPDLPDFNARLVPHRSLGPKGFVILMSLVSAVCFIAGMVFALMGAWPVVGFFGLDVLIVYVAFKLNYRSGRVFETVALNRDNLHITRVHPSGATERFDFDPYWVRVKLDEEPDGRTQLSLYLHERALTFGKFLSDDERRDFASALKNALRDLRGGSRL